MNEYGIKLLKEYIINIKNNLIYYLNNNNFNTVYEKQFILLSIQVLPDEYHNLETIDNYTYTILKTTYNNMLNFSNNIPSCYIDALNIINLLVNKTNTRIR